MTKHEPIVPIEAIVWSGSDGTTRKQYVTFGFSKREMVAAMAMQGLCVPCTPGTHNRNDDIESNDKAAMAVRLADALFAALEKTK